TVQLGVNIVSATAIGVVLGQLLPYAHRLKVHSKDRTAAGTACAVVPEAMDFVEDSLDFFLIVLSRADNAHGRVESGGVGYFRGVEVIDTVARGTVHQVIGGVLVGPSRASAGSFDDFEDGIALDGVVGIDGHAVSVRQAARQAGGIDHVQ